MKESPQEEVTGSELSTTGEDRTLSDAVSEVEGRPKDCINVGDGTLRERSGVADGSPGLFAEAGVSHGDGGGDAERRVGRALHSPTVLRQARRLLGHVRDVPVRPPAARDLRNEGQ